MLFVTVAMSGPMEISRGHAAITGEVCLADPSVTPCPSPAPVFDGPKGQQIRIGVFISGSDALNGFDVSLIAAHTALVPVGVDLTGTVLPGTPTVILECLQDVKISGSVCPGTDTVDTLTYVVSGGLGLLTTPPTTGLLFTAIYNITGTTAVGGISVGYQTGCGSMTSVAGGVCVTISAGANAADAETAQAATFDNSTPPPFVAVSASPSSFGPEFPGVTNTATVTATAMNGYPGLATDAVTFSAVATTGLTATISGTNPCSTLMVSCSVTLSLTASAAGTYSATVTGTYATADSLGNPDTLSGVVTFNVAVDDFSITVSPATVTFSAGSSGTATVTLGSVNGFAGTITLSSGTIIPVTTPPLTITYNPVSVTLTAGQTLTSTATFSGPTAVNTYHAIIKATSGTRVKNSATLTVQVSAAKPDFTVAANPTLVSAAVGAPGASTITVTFIGGFTNTVLISSVTSSASLACSLNPTSVSSTGTSNLSCSGSAPGSFTATVTGTSGTLSHSVVVDYTILQGPDYDVTASSMSIGPVNAGASGTATITVDALRGFTGTVTLAASGSPGLTATLNPTSVTNSGTSILTVSASVAGTYTVTVTGSNSTTFSHSTSPIQVTVVDFGLVANPSSLTIPQGSLKSSNITLVGLNGFAGAVSLTAVGSAGLTVAIAPTVSGAAVVRLNVTASGTIAPGSYNVNVTGVNGSLSHTVEIIVIVPPNDFALSATPSTIPVAVNKNGASTINLSSLAAFAGTVTLTLQLPSSVTGSLSPTTVTLVRSGTGSSVLTVNATLAGTFLVNVTGVSGSLSHTITVTVVAVVTNFTLQSSITTVSAVAGVQGIALLTLAPVNGFTGTVTLASSISPATGLTCSLTPASILLGASQISTLSCSGSAGIYTVTVTGTSGSLSHQSTIAYTITDFSLSAGPTSVKTVAGTAVTSTITVAPVNGFTGTVALTTMASPAGLTCTLSPTSVVLGVSQTSTLSCSSTVANNYVVTVTGAFSGLTHAATVRFNVTDFAVTASPSSVTVNRGLLGNSTITVASVNGFSGTVVVAASPSAADLTCTLTPASVVLGTSLTSMLSCSSATSGSFTVTVTGTSGSLTHTVTLNYAIADISLFTPTPTINVAENTTSFVTVTVSSVSGFSGSVGLALSVTTNVPPSARPLLSLNQNTVTLAAGSYSSVLLNITVGPRAAPGNYGIVVTATSGVLIDSTTIVLTVPRPDFSVTVSPPADSSPIILTPSATGTAGFTLAGLSGFNGSVTFSFTVTPTAGLSCSLSQTSAGLVPGQGTASAAISCHGGAGSYDVAITGTAAELYSTGTTHTAHVGYVVVDFTVRSTPSGILVNTDQQGHAQINVTWAKGYAGGVLLAVVPSNGLSASISPSRLSGSGLATLTVSSGVAGSYSVVVNATSGSNSHTVTVTVTVSSVSNAANIFGVDPTTFYAIVGVLAVALVAGLVALSRRGKKPKK